MSYCVLHLKELCLTCFCVLLRVKLHRCHLLSQWRKIQKTISCFLRVEETWELWEQFRRDCQLFSDWLAQIEEEVRESEIEVRDVAVAKQEISKYEVCPQTDWILFLYFIPFYIDSHLWERSILYRESISITELVPPAPSEPHVSICMVLLFEKYSVKFWSGHFMFASSALR